MPIPLPYVVDDPDVRANFDQLAQITDRYTRFTGGFSAVTRKAVTMTAGGTPKTTIPAGTPGIDIDAYGNVRMGPNELGPTGANSTWVNGETAPDFLYDAASRRVFLRSLLMSEVGDPADMAFQRAGPNNTYPVPAGGMAGVVSGDTLGNIYWRGFNTPNAGTPGVTTGGSFNNKSGQIRCVAAQDIFPNKAGGQLIFSTTAIDGASPTDRVTIDETGLVLFTAGQRVTGGNIQMDAGHLVFPNAGYGIKIRQGTNARMGRATMVAGTVTVANTTATSNTRIFITRDAIGGTQGHLSTSVSPGVSFTVTSTSATETSTVAWVMIEAS